MMQYTVGEDRLIDQKLLRWDVLGSLGHIEGLHHSGLLSATDWRRLRAGLRAALKAIDQGTLTVSDRYEDGHSAIEDWITGRLGTVGGRVHTGRSRNDQVACAIRLYAKDSLLHRQTLAIDLVSRLLDFAGKYRRAVWPGYTHQRRAMPSSAGVWASALAEGILTTAESVESLWHRLDRSPLGTGAGYGVPLPLVRESAMKALGFGGLDHSVGSTQLSRGKLEAAIVFWCSDMAHDLSRLASDVILLSASEYGLLELPAELATGSSIMPHKRNPDLFELTRARAAEVDGHLMTVLQLKSKLTGGYHRDFQLLKEPLFRALDRTGEMLAMMVHVIPHLGVDVVRAKNSLASDVVSTDEVMRRVEAGTPFRTAYREVAAEISRGGSFPVPPVSDILRRRQSTGGAGNLALGVLRKRLTTVARWNRREQGRFSGALRRLSGSRIGRKGTVVR
jgi:argininosuccinate lyase